MKFSHSSNDSSPTKSPNTGSLKNKIPVRINNKLTIFISPDKDPEETRKKYLEKESWNEIKNSAYIRQLGGHNRKDITEFTLEESKICNYCNKRKHINDFYKNAVGKKGKAGLCRKCYYRKYNKNQTNRQPIMEPYKIPYDVLHGGRKT